ncbi:MAG: autotransporter [Solirubrobacterales bacterium]|nr:autotransporter [Solirubrobacterales bacterium]
MTDVRRQMAWLSNTVVLGIVCCVLFAWVANAGGALKVHTARPLLKAHVARTLILREVGHLHLTSKRGFVLNEQGTVSGTISGTLYIHLRLVSSSRVIAELNIYPHGGSLSGSGTSGYQVRGAFANFSGYLAVTRGTGSYSRAHASSLKFTGSIQRRNDSVTVQLSGPLSV